MKKLGSPPPPRPAIAIVMAHPPRLFSEYFRLKDIVELDGDNSSLRDQRYPFDDLKEELLYPS